MLISGAKFNKAAERLNQGFVGRGKGKSAKKRGDDEIGVWGTGMWSEIAPGHMLAFIFYFAIWL